MFKLNITLILKKTQETWDVENILHIEITQVVCPN